MKPWRSVVVPHRDIREGRFDESVFAASLSDVVQGRGPLEYQDAATFFRKTYPTQGLVKLLSAVVGRLAETGHGEAVIQIQTPFGGGKTHALVALYHLFRAMPVDAEVVERVLQESGAGAIPDTRTLTFDGTAVDPLGGRTPWGELAAQMGRYDVLREHDQKRRSPGKDLLYQLLADAPTLILMDEIAEYATKARDFREQVMAFFQELTETVKVLPRCALVVTLPASAPYGEEGERALGQLQCILGRVEAIYTPVEGAEVYEVIRRRLFEDLGDPQEARLVVEGYWQMYQRLGEDMPAEAREPAYRERMRLAYPFHPQLIDILYERWSTFPTFQRTRGVLRLLAHVVADLYQREHPAPLIQAAHLNLTNPQIRREFLKHIGNEYEGVIAADIVDSNAKAQRMDREMGSEYARFGVASSLATAIFFGSFSGGERRGIVVPGLRLALLRESIPPAIVGDALGRLEDELWFLHVEGGLYQFRNQPNLNRVILEREEAVSEADIAAQIQGRLEKMAGSELKVTLFPGMPGDIPDSRELKLALLGGDHPGRDPATTQFVEDLLNKTSTAFRTYRNTLLVLAPDAGELATLRQQVKRSLALKAIHDDKNLVRTLSDENKKTLESKLEDAVGAIDWHLLAAYRHLARVSAEGSIAWLDLGLPTTGERGSLARRVREFLKSQDILLERLGPRHVLEKALGKEEREKRLGDIYEAFLRYPHLPLLDSEAVLRRAIMQGVREGTFGVRIGERLSFRESVAEPALDQECVLVRPDVAEEEILRKAAEIVTPPIREVVGGETILTGAGATVAPPVVVPQVVTRLVLKVRVPWDKMGDFVRGVLMPLHSDEATLGVEIEIDAHSAKGIQKSTLERKVDETLRQIGAEVLERRQE
jgi:hypothetical protein